MGHPAFSGSYKNPCQSVPALETRATGQYNCSGMRKQLRIASVNFALTNATDSGPLEADTALFDFDVVLIRPPRFGYLQGDPATYRRISSLMAKKQRELDSLFKQGGVLVVILDVPCFYRADSRANSGVVSNYDFLHKDFAQCLQGGTGTQITYTSDVEPFVGVLKKSNVQWTAYLDSLPPRPFNVFQGFGRAGSAGWVAGKMPYLEGNLILLPNVSWFEEVLFVEACAEYRFKRQGTVPPDWVENIVVPGMPEIESSLANLDKAITDLQTARQSRQVELEGRAAYRKLLFEKGKTQLEPIVLRALDDLGFGTSPSEIVKGTNHEIDGRTSNGSVRGIVEVKGSKNVIAQSEFSSFVTKVLADADVSNTFSKGIFVGNGLCESEPANRLGDTVFSGHVLDGAKRHSVSLVNSVELYWLCCAILRGDVTDKAAVRETILSCNGYVDLKLFCGESVFTSAAGCPGHP